MRVGDRKHDRVVVLRCFDVVDEPVGRELGHAAGNGPRRAAIVGDLDQAVVGANDDDTGGHRGFA